jgi:DNA-binding transcriptional LysR family regulator
VVVTLQQLRYFLAAVERGSVSAAAEACFVSQPSLSEQLRRLEQGLGVALFVRTNRGLLLTDAGRLLVPRAERAVAAARDAEEAVRAAGAIVSGTVAFGTFSTAHHLALGAAIAAFRERHPGVRLRVLSRNSTEIGDAVRRGELEAGLVALPLDDRGLEVGGRVRESEAVYVTADRGRLDAPRSIQQLAAAQLVLPEVSAGDDDPTRRQLRERAAAAGVRLEPVVEVESPAAALDLVVRGVGDTIASLALIGELGLADRLAWVSLEPPLVERFVVVTRRGAQLSAATAALLALVEEHLGLARPVAPAIGPSSDEGRDAVMDGCSRLLHPGSHAG